MPIVCFSLQHDHAPAGAIGMMSASADERAVLARQWIAGEPRVAEALTIVTCNRVEWWGVVESVCPARHGLQRTLSAWCGREVALDEAAGWQTLENDRAIEHLLRVACGLEAMVRGEGEILGQVRRAHEEGLAAGTVGDELHALFRRVVKTARGLRHRELANASGRTRSAAQAAAAMARQRAEQYRRGAAPIRVLIVGAGAVAGDVAGCVAAWADATTTIVNRTADRAETLARLHGFHAAELGELDAALAEAEVVFATTFHPGEVFDAAAMAAVIARRTTPLVFVDLSAAEGAYLGALVDSPLLSLLTLGDLGEAATANDTDRVARFEAAVARELPELLRWRRSLEADRIANDVRRRLDDIRREHLVRYVGAGEELPLNVDAMSQSLLNAVLHEVTASIRALDPADADDARAMATVQRLFNLHVPASTPGERTS